jgi:signal recognition particle subunit SRP54
MFDSLSDKLQTALDGLKRQGKLTDKDVERAAREIRLALLEADVNYKVVKQFVEKVKERVLGSEVLESLTPGQQFVKIVNEELTALMGSASTKLTFSPRLPTVIMMVGLQGSGKTTACGKLANFLLAQGKSPVLAAGDVYRPAAVDQLKTLGAQLGVPVYDEGTTANPVDIAKHAVEWARDKGRDVLIIDTAGRLHTKFNLMEELKKINRVAGKALPGAPHQVWLVLDATVGQNALQQARSFKDAVYVTGAILSKLDSSARGGMAFAIQRELGLPILFAGLGEKPEDLQPFDPDAFVDGILSSQE